MASNDAAVDHRDWQGYVRSDDCEYDELAFTGRDLAIEYVASVAHQLTGEDVSPEDFEQQNENVWTVDLSGPYTGYVVHSAVYSEVPA